MALAILAKRKTYGIGAFVGVGSDKDRALEQLCARRADRFLGTRSLSPEHLWLLTRILLRLLFVPKVRLRLDNEGEAQSLKEWLGRCSLGLRTPLHEAASVLTIDRRDDPLSASKFATLRRMDRKAGKLGIVCREVAESERQHLLEHAIAFEQQHPDPRYRRASPNVDGLRSVGLWLVAEDAQRRPLALAVIPVSGNASLLRYMRTLSGSREATLARYALTAELIRVLSKKRVRYLVDNLSPIAVPSRLRHFATMVGFRILRAQLCTANAT